MRKSPFTVILFLALSCAVAGTGTIRGVFDRLEGYDVRVTGAADALSIERLFPKEAPFFVEFGADSSIVAECNPGYRIEVLTFLSPKGAMAAFRFMSGPDAKPVQAGFAGLATADAVRFVKGEYLVVVKPAAGGDSEGALVLARAIAKRIPRTGFAPELYLPLPKDGLVRGSEFYFKGPKVFSTRFPGELAEALSVGSALEGVTARYSVRGTEMNLIKLRFTGRTRTVEVISSFIESCEGLPITRPGANRDFYTIFNKDGSEMYVAEFADWLFFVPDGPRGGDAQQLIEYAMRSM